MIFAVRSQEFCDLSGRHQDDIGAPGSDSRTTTLIPSQVDKRMRTTAKENEALKGRITETDRARELAEINTRRNSDKLRLLTEQRDNLLLGATRAGKLSASSPADALAELLAAAAGDVTDGTEDHAHTAAPARRQDVKFDDRKTEELEVELEQARAEAKLARVAMKQERLRREGAAKEKEEAEWQLHRLMGAAKRAVNRKEARLRSSRMETEVVWHALTEAVR